MAEAEPATRCAICDGPNDCALAAPGGRVEACWCAVESFPDALLARVPDGARGRCICRRCLEAATRTRERGPGGP